MSSSTWVSCPENWMLQDVQAGLNVVITLLSFLASYVLVQICWQRGAKQAAKGRTVPLRSLLMVASLGEVFDTITFFRCKLFSRKYVKVLAQCFTVIVLSAAAIFSGPIARYSSRRFLAVEQRRLPGFLATNTPDSVLYLEGLFNSTIFRLEKAQFPTNQLLDFLPDNTANWVFDSKEWNNSWTLDCQYTEATTLQARSLDKDCGTYCLGLDSLDTVSSYRASRSTSFFWDYVTHRSKEGRSIMDIHAVIYSANYTHDILSTDRTTTIHMDLVLFFSTVPASAFQARNTSCPFSPALTFNLTYSKIACNLELANESQTSDYVTAPNVDDSKFLTSAYASHFFPRWAQVGLSNLPMSPISPHDLVRFYQTYMIVKDTWISVPAERTLSVRVNTVQISVLFLAFASLVALLIILGLANFAMFYARYHKQTLLMPQSRLQWMIQSIEAEDRPTTATTQELGARKSVTVDHVANWAMLSPAQRQRAEFEAAMYSDRETTTWFLDRESNSQDGMGSLVTYEGHKSVGLLRTSVRQQNRQPLAQG